MLRFAGVFIVDIVGWDGELGKVIQKVVEQHLHRQHGEERQHRCGDRHAQHIAEVGTGAHKQVLHDVAEGAPAFHDALMQYAQARLKENDVCSVLGYVDGMRRRDAYIRHMHSRGIVDSVSDKADNMPPPPQCADNANLLCRRQPSEDAGLFRDMQKSRFAELFEIVPKHNARDGHPRFRAYMCGDEIAIA